MWVLGEFTVMVACGAEVQKPTHLSLERVYRPEHPAATDARLKTRSCHDRRCGKQNEIVARKLNNCFRMACHQFEDGISLNFRLKAAQTLRKRRVEIRADEPIGVITEDINLP